VLLSEPGRTDYDFSFSFLGFPVRVHPAFFVMPVLLGRGLILDGVNPGVGFLLVTLIFFVSILIHEIGHALAFRYYGIPSRVVLYWMGGLAIPESNYGGHRSRSLTSNQQIVVSMAGPIFGFLLAGVLVGITYIMGGFVTLNTFNIIPFPEPVLNGTPFNSRTVMMVMFGGIALNIILNLFNLVPIYPLDGGQVARQLMVKMDSSNGVRHSIILSIVASGMITVFALMNKQSFLALFFGFMAWSNYQSLQNYGRSRW
jgi:Zn-dependent protease